MLIVYALKCFIIIVIIMAVVVLKSIYAVDLLQSEWISESDLLGLKLHLNFCNNNVIKRI